MSLESLVRSESSADEGKGKDSASGEGAIEALAMIGALKEHDSAVSVGDEISNTCSFTTLRYASIVSNN